MPSDYEKDIENGELQPVYILVSDQPLLLSQASSALISAAVSDELRGFNLDVFTGKGASGVAVASALRTLPMMGPRRGVVVRDIAAMAAGELAHLLPAVTEPTSSSVLIATAAKVDKRIKFFAAAKKAKFLHELGAPRNLTRWIQGAAKTRSIRIADRAAARLADAVGKDLARLSLSLDQLDLYADGDEIQVAHVDNLIAQTKEKSVFELTDAIGGGDLGGAVRAVDKLCDQRQSAIGVVMMLARFVRQLSACQAAVAADVPRAGLARAAGVPPFAVDKLVAQAGRYQPRAIASSLSRLASADAQLKGLGDVSKALGRDLSARVILEGVVRSLIECQQSTRGRR